jgi:myo-inositol-1(or 4)-monophosphatase
VNQRIQDDLQRIAGALREAASVVHRTQQHSVQLSYKDGGDPVTSVDQEINHVLQAILPQPGEGWLSEESQDDHERLARRRVWIVDPLDGTREFLQRIPEWCVSIGLVEDGQASAGGVLNPTTGEMFLASFAAGLQVIESQPPLEKRPVTGRARVLVSRREFGEGKWPCQETGGAVFVPVGSIAYRLAQVAAGWADATCTFDPRHEWDVAAGVALVEIAGGRVQTLSGKPVRFNRATPRLDGLLAFSSNCHPDVANRLASLFSGCRTLVLD